MRKGGHVGLQGAGRATPQELGSTGHSEMGVPLSGAPEAKCFLKMPVLITDSGDPWMGSVWLMIPEGACKPRGL